MLVVIANNLPDAVRGRMKLWFIEPKPNVFVSNIKDHTAKKVIEYLMEFCDKDSGVLIFEKTNKQPGYKITMIGNQEKDIIDITGLQLFTKKTKKEIDKHPF